MPFSHSFFVISYGLAFLYHVLLSTSLNRHVVLIPRNSTAVIVLSDSFIAVVTLSRSPFYMIVLLLDLSSLKLEEMAP